MSNKIIISIILILTFTRINYSQTESEIRGRVLFKGKPAENAVVNISSQTALAKTNSVRSDKSGGFSFKLPSGKYYITAEANIDGAKASAARELLAEPGKATVIELEMLIRLPNEIVTIAVNQNQLSDEVSKTVAAVGAEELRQRADFSLAETLRTAASLRVQQLGGFGRTASIKARGLRNQDTAILIDGVRLRDASSITGDASAFISDLTLTSVSKIEILRGPGSSLYGTNAVGATVSLVTPNPQNRPSGQISYAIGGLGLQRFRGNLSDGTSDGRFGFNIAVSRTAYTQGIDGNDEAFNTNFQGRIDYNPLRKLNLSGNIFVSDAFVKLNSNPDTVGTMPVSNSVIIEAKENVNFTPDVDDPDSQQRSKFVLGSINANFIISNSGTFTAYYSGVKTTRKNDNGPLGIGFQSAGTSIFGGDIQTAGGRLSIAAAGSGVLQLGYEFENENYLNEGKTPSGSGNFTTRASQSSNAIFAQFISSQFFKRLQLTGGFRFQDFELRTPRFSSTNSPYQGLQGLDPPHAITFDGSAVYGIEKTGTSLRFHVGNGYRVPSLYERYGTFFSGFFNPPFVALGDPELKPERSFGFDAGIEQKLIKSKLKLSAVYFYTKLLDTIGFGNVVRNIGSTPRPFGGYLNQKGGIARGVEFSADILPYKSSLIRANYTFTNSDQKEPQVNGSGLIKTLGIPDHRFGLVINQNFARAWINFDLEATSSYLAPIFSNSTFQTYVYRFRGNRRADLTAGYNIPLNGEKFQMRVFGTIENLFDFEYFENGFRTAGRSARIGASFGF